MESSPLSSGASQSHHIFTLRCSRLPQIIGCLPPRAAPADAAGSAPWAGAPATRVPTDAAAPSLRKSLRSIIMRASVTAPTARSNPKSSLLLPPRLCPTWNKPAAQVQVLNGDTCSTTATGSWRKVASAFTNAHAHTETRGRSKLGTVPIRRRRGRRTARSRHCCPNFRRASHGSSRLPVRLGLKSLVDHRASHTSPGTTPKHSLPCRIARSHSAQRILPDSCREVPRSARLHCTRRGPNRRQISCCFRGSWPEILKSCCPRETVGRSSHPAPPAPTPLPLAIDSHWLPNSQKPHPFHHWSKPA